MVNAKRLFFLSGESWLRNRVHKLLRAFVLKSSNTDKMAFSFNFGGEDIDQTVDQDVPILDAPLQSNSANEEEAPLVDVRQHDLRELVGFAVFKKHLFLLFFLYLLISMSQTG